MSNYIGSDKFSVLKPTMFSFSFYLFQVLVQKVCADANATSPVSARSSNEQSFGMFSLVMFPLSKDL